MTKIFLDNNGLITPPYFGKDNYAVVGLSEHGYECLKRFLDTEEFKGTLNKLLSEFITSETDLDGIKFVMVLNEKAFLYVIGCLNTSVLFNDEPLAITDICQIVFQQVTLDSYSTNKTEQDYHLFSIDNSIYIFSYKREKGEIANTLASLADKGDGKEPSVVWHSAKPDVTSSNELLLRMATLDFNMTEQELSDALVAASLPKVKKNEEIATKSNPLSDHHVIGDNSHIQRDNASDTQAKSDVPVG